MAHARDRAAGRPEEREDEGTVQPRPEVEPCQLDAVALEGNLFVRLRQRLHERDGFGVGQGDLGGGLRRDEAGSQKDKHGGML